MPYNTPRVWNAIIKSPFNGNPLSLLADKQSLHSKLFETHHKTRYNHISPSALIRNEKKRLEDTDSSTVSSSSQQPHRIHSIQWNGSHCVHSALSRSQQSDPCLPFSLSLCLHSLANRFMLSARPLIRIDRILDVLSNRFFSSRWIFSVI